MAWVRLDDGFATDPKVVEAGPLGLAMQVAALCYCNQKLTDGHLPGRVAATLIDLTGLDVTWEQVVDGLVDLGMWHEPNHACPTCPALARGYYLHDYLEFQPSPDHHPCAPKGDDSKPMNCVSGERPVKATRADLLAALGVNTDDLERFRSHMEWDCCQWISGNQVMVDKDLHNAMWRVLDALTGWSDDDRQTHHTCRHCGTVYEVAHHCVPHGRSD